MYFYQGELYHEEQIQLSINDNTWLYGATIFTTLRVYQHSLTHPLTNWEAHRDRLAKSIVEFNWQFPNWENITEGATLLLPHYSVLRITLFPDGRELIIGRNLPSQLEKQQQEGITAQVITNYKLQRPIADHKTGNYLTAYLARQQAQQLGYEEAILTDTESNWLETSTGNLWGYSQGVWFTPQLNGNLLPGIARKFILQQAKFTIIENQWTPEFVETLEAIGYSNSVIEIIPFKLIQWHNQTIKLNPHHCAYNCLQKIFKLP